MLFKRFRRKPATEAEPTAPEPTAAEATAADAAAAQHTAGPDRDGMITLSGTGWTGELYREIPVRVPWQVDVDEFLSRRPLPYLWPDIAEYRAFVDANEHPEQWLRLSWIDAFLHHPDDGVVIQCLRDAFTGDNLGNLTSLADILGYAYAPEVKREAAKALWRVSDAGVHWVFNVLLSRGAVPSDYTASSVHEAIAHLRATCPPDRTGTLTSELTTPDED
ncbi:hypothetical protein [Streptomyces sp. NPDC056244]|uniref:hypothetical protein n=1 Tax=Streptomyces sp. NPDC056244 TaxID=3345762 RepID=UPI0035DF89BB